LGSAVESDQVTLIEVGVGDSRRIQLMRAKGLLRDTARRALGQGLVKRIKDWRKGK
jgi:hypothetical protein